MERLTHSESHQVLGQQEAEVHSVFNFLLASS